MWLWMESFILFLLLIVQSCRYSQRTWLHFRVNLWYFQEKRADIFFRKPVGVIPTFLPKTRVK